MNPTAAKPGDVLDGRYTIGRQIGRGAMADVFEAIDDTGREVAVKILRSMTARDAEAQARLRREAQVLQMVRHPNVATLHAMGVADGLPYLVLELLRGRNLAVVLKQFGRLDARAAVTCAWQALGGLAATHAVGVLHRDLKPGNLVIEAGGGVERIVLIDFGFASLEGGAQITQQGHVVGSLSYVAPERLRGEKEDERGDLYSLGIVLWELLVGRPPFQGVDAEIMSAHLSRAPAPPSTAAPDAQIPPAVDALVLRALAKQARDRTRSAADMAQEIEAAAKSWGT